MNDLRTSVVEAGAEAMEALPYDTIELRNWGEESVADTEVVEAEWDGHGRAFLPFGGSSAGRYLIAPIDGPE